MGQPIVSPLQSSHDARSMLTISRFAALAGIAPSALRFYDRKQLLRPAQRLPNGYRVYSAGQIGTARLIASLRHAGLSLSGVRDFLGRDVARRQALLDEWREHVAMRLHAIQMADLYLRGVDPAQPQIHFRRWEKPSCLVWFPATAEARALPFGPSIAARARQLARLRVPVLSGGYVRTRDLAGDTLHGEVGFRIAAGTCRHPLDARVEEIRPVLFVTLECGIHDETAAHRVFRFLEQFSFAPAGLSLERYLPGTPDRYELLIAVNALTPDADT